MDEAGCGPWAGPVVAAAVVLGAGRLRGVRIDDSKRLTPLARQRAFDRLLERADIGVGIVCAEAIDRFNIRQAALLAMRQAIDDLFLPPDYVLVDGTAVPPLNIPCRAIVRGDASCYVISCASIIAKVLRDRLMAFYHRLAPDYAFDQHKGYGTGLHAARLRQFGPSVFHRMSFRPVATLGPAAAEEGAHALVAAPVR